MSAAEQLEEHPIDVVLEARLAQLIGTTAKALEHKRLRKIIPEGVWNKQDGRIFYSISRYNAWQESRWTCQPEWSQSANDSESDSPGIRSGDAKRSPTPRHRRGSQRRPVFEIK